MCVFSIFVRMCTFLLMCTLYIHTHFCNVLWAIPPGGCGVAVVWLLPYEKVPVRRPLRHPRLVSHLLWATPPAVDPGAMPPAAEGRFVYFLYV